MQSHLLPHAHDIASRPNRKNMQWAVTDGQARKGYNLRGPVKIDSLLISQFARRARLKYVAREKPREKPRLAWPE